MKNINKKIIICLLASVLGVTVAVAQSTEEMETYISEQAATSLEASQEQTEKANEKAATTAIPELSAEQLAELNEKLPAAADRMTFLRECGIGTDRCSAEYLGVLVADRVIEFSFDGTDLRGTNEAKRATYFAVNKLLPKEYLKEVPTFKEYSKTYPGSTLNWDKFRKAAVIAQEDVYNAVVTIADETYVNYPAGWLHDATH